MRGATTGTDSGVQASPSALHFDLPLEEIVRALLDRLDRSCNLAAPGYAVVPVPSAMSPDHVIGLMSESVTRVVSSILVRRGQQADLSRCRLNVFYARDGALPIEIVGESMTFKALHLDPHSIVFAHLYHPTTNLRPIEMRLIDVASYLRSSSLTPAQVFEPRSVPHDPDRLVARPEHRRRLIATHTIHTQVLPVSGDPVVVFVRNDPIEGVAHEVSDPEPVLPSSSFERNFVRVSVSLEH